MILIIPNIPVDTTYLDIKNFISPGLQKGFWPFKKEGRIERIKILIYKDTNNSGKIEYHALITILDEDIGKQIIKKCNRKKLLSKLVNVRNYEIRSWQNDRRLNHSIIKDKQFEGNRKGDRRRGKALEELKDVSPLFYGVKELARKF